MIKTQNKVPSVYYKESRDFQLLGRIKDVIFNYIKNNTLAVKDITTNLNPNQKVLELMCNTLGFNPKHEYNNLELSALCSIFISCMKAKGSKKAIMLLLEMITSIENSSFKPEIVTDYDGDQLIILLPPDIKDWTLIRDVLDYILPSGKSYTLQNQTIFKKDNLTTINTSSNVEQGYSWDYVSSSIIKQKEMNVTEEEKYIPSDEIVNYNVPMMADSTGKATTDNENIDKSEVNKDISSITSRILSMNDTENNTEEVAEQRRINNALTESTTEGGNE